MAYPEFEIEAIFDGQQIRLKVVKIERTFLIYRNGKAQAALNRSGGQWEQFLLEPLPQELFSKITERLDEIGIDQ